MKAQLRLFIEEKKKEGCAKLPTDRKLCEIFGVSRPTIAKHLAMLASEGAIIRKHGSGTYIVGCDTRVAPITIGLGLRNALLYTDAYFGKLMNSVSRACQSSNANIQIFDSLVNIFKSNEHSNSLTKSIASGILDGFLLASRMPPEISGAICRNIPTVTINNIIDTGSAINVSCDYFKSGFLAAEHLCHMGHKNIAFAAYSANHPDVWRNLSGAQCALRSAGIPFSEDSVVFLNGLPGKQVETFLEFRKQNKATAIYFINSMSVDFYKKLIQADKDIPRDLSIISAGDFGACERFELTAIDTKIKEVCERGVNLLCKKLRKEPIANNFHIVQPELIERSSVKKISNAS